MKSGYQTALKVISIIMIVLAALSIVGGLLLMAGGGLLGSVANNPEVVGDITATINSEGVTVTQEQAGIVVAGVGILGGAMSILGGILMLIVGILGVRGANDPRKIGPFRVFAIIGLVFSILGIIALLFQPSDPSMWVSGIIGVIETAVCVWLAQKIKNQTYRY